MVVVVDVVDVVAQLKGSAPEEEEILNPDLDASVGG